MSAIEDWSEAYYELIEIQSMQQRFEMQITLDVTNAVGDWFSENWKVLLDNISAISGVAGGGYGVFVAAGTKTEISWIAALPQIPLAGQVALFALSVWGLARLWGWIE